MNGAEVSTFALARSMPDPKADAQTALQRAFPDSRVCVGEIYTMAGRVEAIGFGVVFSEHRRHAVKVPSFADVDDAISLLRMWEDENA